MSERGRPCTVNNVHNFKLFFFSDIFSFFLLGFPSFLFFRFSYNRLMAFCCTGLDWIELDWLANANVNMNMCIIQYHFCEPFF